MRIRINRKIVFIAALIGGVMAFLAVFRLLSSLEEKQNNVKAENAVVIYPSKQPAESNVEETNEVIFRNGQKYARRKGLETVLVMGLDKYETDVRKRVGTSFNYQQADFCLLLVLDHDNKTCTPIHINRDTMTDVPVITIDGKDGGTLFRQLALAHTYGTGRDDSCKNTARAVSNLMYGIPIDHYMSLTMDAVPIVNDNMGGVTLEIKDDFSMIDESMQLGKTMTLNGEQALKYVRARSDLENSTNLHRMERQRQYLGELLDTARGKIKDDDGLMMNTVLSVSPYLVSDYSAEQLAKTAENVLKYDNTEILSPDGEALMGEKYLEYYIDDEALKELVLEVFYEGVNT